MNVFCPSKGYLDAKDIYHVPLFFPLFFFLNLRPRSGLVEPGPNLHIYNARKKSIKVIGLHVTPQLTDRFASPQIRHACRDIISDTNRT